LPQFPSNPSLIAVIRGFRSIVRHAEKLWKRTNYVLNCSSFKTLGKSVPQHDPHIQHIASAIQRLLIFPPSPLRMNAKFIKFFRTALISNLIPIFWLLKEFASVLIPTISNTVSLSLSDRSICSAVLSVKSKRHTASVHEP